MKVKEARKLKKAVALGTRGEEEMSHGILQKCFPLLL